MLKRQPVQLLREGRGTLSFQRLEGLLLPPPPLFVFLVSLLDARCDFLELLQVATDGGRGSIERLAVLGLVPVRVCLQLLEDQVGVAV